MLRSIGGAGLILATFTYCTVSLCALPISAAAAPFSVTRLPSGLTPIRMLPSGEVMAYSGNSADGASFYLFSKTNGKQDLGSGVIPMGGATNLKANFKGDGVFSTLESLSKPFDTGTKKLVIREKDGTLKTVLSNDDTLLSDSWMINDSKHVVALFTDGSQTRLKAYDSQTQAYSVIVTVELPMVYLLNDGRVLIKNYQTESNPKPHLVVSATGAVSTLSNSTFPADSQVIEVRSNSTVVLQSGSKLYSSNLVNPATELAVAIGEGGSALAINTTNSTLAIKNGRLAYIAGAEQVDSIPCSFQNKTRLNFNPTDLGSSGTIADDGSVLLERIRAGSTPSGFSILTPKSLSNVKDYCPRVSVRLGGNCDDLYKQVAGTKRFEANSGEPVSCSITVRTVSRTGQPIRGMEARIVDRGTRYQDADGGDYRSPPKFVRSRKTNSEGYAVLNVRLTPKMRDYEVTAPYLDEDFRSSQFVLEGYYSAK